jgi:hypothetical protein
MKTLIFTHPHVLFVISSLPFETPIKCIGVFNICIHLWDKLVKVGHAANDILTSLISVVVKVN